MRASKPRAKRKKTRVSPEEARRRRTERRFKADIRTIFVNAGFHQVPTRDVNITVNSLAGDLDSVFLFENVVVIVEDTTSASKNIGDHLRKKAEYFKHLGEHHIETVRVLREHFDRFDQYYQSARFEAEEYQLRFVYASYNEIDETYQARYAHICKAMSRATLQYFLSLTKTIKRSARFELLKFLDVPLQQLGSRQAFTESNTFPALHLPEVPSGFPRGHKLVSFLVDPATLLERAYVLRADSWRDREALYQRLLIKNKIVSMRNYLTDEKRVFINNIIVTLGPDATYRPTESEVRDQHATHISVGELTIPRRFDAIGIIDGQHRVYAYHEGDDGLDGEIAGLRRKQHLLVTGIIYPASIKQSEAEAFEAKLFLEINDKQNRVKGDLKQAIEMVINPCSDVAIAKAVLHRLGATGPLVGVLALHFFDTGKLKTTSIVSYGLRHIVGIKQPVSFFGHWRDASKHELHQDSCDREVLGRYVNYCGNELNKFIGGLKVAQPQDLWTTDQKHSRLLTTTTINGLVFCMRLLLQNNKLGSFEYYRSRFERLSLDFRPGKFQFKSSHWRKLGEHIYKECFKNT